MMLDSLSRNTFYATEGESLCAVKCISSYCRSFDNASNPIQPSIEDSLYVSTLYVGHNNDFQSKNAQSFLLARDSRLLNVLASSYNSLAHEVKPLQLEKPLFLSRSHNPEASKTNEVAAGKRIRRKKKTQEDETSVTSKIGSISANDSESVCTQESQEPTPKRSSKNGKEM